MKNKKNIRKDYYKKFKELEIKYKILINAYNLACRELYSRSLTFYTDEQFKKFKKYLIVKGNEYDENGKIRKKTFGN